MPVRIAAVLLLCALAAPVSAAPAAGPGTERVPGFDAYAQRMAVLLDRYRQQHGLPALPLDRTLVALAAEHSAAMAKARRMDHDDFPSRARRSGLALCVENVGWNYPTPDAQFDAWRASPGHDRNLRDPRVERVGIAVASGYATLIACGK